MDFYDLEQGSLFQLWEYWSSRVDEVKREYGEESSEYFDAYRTRLFYSDMMDVYTTKAHVELDEETPTETIDDRGNRYSVVRMERDKLTNEIKVSRSRQLNSIEEAQYWVERYANNKTRDNQYYFEDDEVIIHYEIDKEE